MDTPTWTIGELGKRAGLPTKTIRFYEHEGLLPVAGRAANGYRTYTPDVLDRLLLIKAVRELDVSIPEIRTLIHGCRDGSCSHPPGYLEDMIDRYVARLDDRIGKLVTLKRKFLHLRRELSAGLPSRDGYCCDILRQVASATGKGVIADAD